MASGTTSTASASRDERRGIALHHLLVVCVGNICRSPMAQALLAQALPACKVRSVGLEALVGQPADPLACALMAERGLDIGAHRAHQIRGSICLSADLILAMDEGQRAEIERRYPAARGKVFRLGEYGGGDVPDPYRCGRPVFEEALARIDEGVRQWVERISKLASR